MTLVDQLLRAEAWARGHADETRVFLRGESNASELLVQVAYGNDAHLRLDTDLAETSVAGLQDFATFVPLEFLAQQGRRARLDRPASFRSALAQTRRRLSGKHVNSGHVR